MCKPVMSAATETIRVADKPAKKAATKKQPAGEDKVIAERFRTKQCRNFVEKGTCPYESRCMFAHGDQQLRTTEMNLRDGLVSEEAIRQFKRASMAAKSRSQPARTIAPTYFLPVQAAEPACVVAAPCFCDECSPRNSSHALSSAASDASLDELCGSVVEYFGNSYRYNPYGWSAIDVSAPQFP